MSDDTKRTALLVVDVQNDFLPPDGKLAVDNGRDILPRIRELLDEQKNWPWVEVIASQDYHPRGHISFVTSHPGCEDKVFKSIQIKTPQGEEIDQILWPEHCVHGTSGCEIEESIQEALKPWQAKGKYHLVQKDCTILTSNLLSPTRVKGTDKDMDAYSAFASPTTPSITATHHRDTSSAAASSPLATYLHSKNITQLVIVGIATDVCVKATAEDALTCGFNIVLVGNAVKGVSAEKSRRTLEDLGERKEVKVVDSVEELEAVL